MQFSQFRWPFSCLFSIFYRAQLSLSRRCIQVSISICRCQFLVQKQIRVFSFFVACWSISNFLCGLISQPYEHGSDAPQCLYGKNKPHATPFVPIIRLLFQLTLHGGPKLLKKSHFITLRAKRATFTYRYISIHFHFLEKFPKFLLIVQIHILIGVTKGNNVFDLQNKNYYLSVITFFGLV